MRYSYLFLMLLALVGCSQKETATISLLTLKEEATTLAKLTDDAAVSAIIFLSPECPLCKNYSVTLREMNDSLGKKDVAFVGVVSGTFYTSEEINKYRIFHDLEFPIVQDPEFLLANALGATITPEVVVLDSNFKKIYSGAIDNWAISLGRQRQVISEHYLADAIEAVLEGKPLETAKTQAVGCFIQ